MISYDELLYIRTHTVELKEDFLLMTRIVASVSVIQSMHLDYKKWIILNVSSSRYEICVVAVKQEI